ncbi:fumarylacetoacetate hydrolase family protein [Microlunatus parietis]|uniref:2-dehydro-3-deoxy-D-arabinonate dehydratase n=1 Tax=Microlunatus parietis TaxID=682979 RepID=A0A7Y9LDY7_9ACTN|nr:fumarylacetoacetate hydrolase family protein [Microlunatus parietis]NYE73290.1 2-dehydro-3-deoxy-D-arabinonate dehydratase [Microlunatus parietis]
MIIRYALDGTIAVGVRTGDVVRRIGDDLASLARLPLAEFREAVEQPTGPELPLDRVTVLPPVDGRTEVWAAGVTYKISQTARMAESETSATVYEQVYDADRPEIFLKSVAWRVVGDGGELRVRADSEIDVPEPELALLINSGGEIIGYGVCNDLSSRSIEGENPLYLPQAKIYNGSCGLGAGVTPVWQVDDPYALELALMITRDGEQVWSGSTSTAQLHRRFDDLVGWLRRELDFPDGVWLSTGTSLVPELPFTLADGDRVTITIPGVGELSNPIRRG